MSEEIPFISLNNISDTNFVFNQLYKNPHYNYYWTDSFSPEFYILLAKRGLISTSMNYAGYGDILLPEMQKEYAVLDFKNIHISRKAKKLFNEDHSLVIAQDLDKFIPLLKNYHGKECWLTDEYSDLLYRLTSYTMEKDNFKLVTVILYRGYDITSGEIGYFIGKTYTSLTGFFNRSFNNWGNFQLVLLAKELEDRGVSFWNLGHPYMEYKIKLGAEIISREKFLNRWLPGIVRSVHQA